MSSVTQLFEQFAMPFRDYEMIDVARAEKILGASKNAVIRLIKAGHLAAMQRGGERGHWSVRYWSVVEYCDFLRKKHGIPDRRRELAHSGARWRDDELLPFALTDTLNVPLAMRVMDIPKRTLHQKLEDGTIESYQLMDGWDWRISRTSLKAFHERRLRYAETVPRSDFRIAP